jgi:hypothetical protein
MVNIFISYRPDDSAGITKLLHDRLATWSPIGKVFLNVHDILATANWQVIRWEQLRVSDVVLAVIGPKWLPTLRQRSESGVNDCVRSQKLCVRTSA